MKKKPYDDDAIRAFREYGQDAVMSTKDGSAVYRALMRLRVGEEEIVRDVYMLPKGCASCRQRGDLVRRCAMERCYSISQVYYILDKARRYYAEERGLLKKRTKKKRKKKH